MDLSDQGRIVKEIAAGDAGLPVEKMHAPDRIRYAVPDSCDGEKR